jgi:hypothetical protein
MNAFRTHFIYYALILFALISVLTIAFFNGTGDAGDSVYHYLFARYAPEHPELYFDHWAKPVFVLLASPFAQFGFTGIKAFNCLVSGFTILITCKLAALLKYRNVELVPVIMMFSPLYYILTFSGLTEPLFALFTVTGIYLCAKNKYSAAAVVISLLPYVRSEGLIIAGVFALYFLVKRKWNLIPLLLTGSLIYSLAGYFIYGDLLWVFSKIPYAQLSSAYGSGPISHFFHELVNVTGVPLYILLWVGFIAMILKSIRKKIAEEEQVLVWLGFSCFFLAHTLFWYLGIFNSMGLKRVFIGVMPLMAIIILQGFNFVTEEIFKPDRYKKWIQALLVIYIVVFPFTPNPAAIQWKKDLTLNIDQVLVHECARELHARKLDKPPVLFNHRYFSIALGLDYFDARESGRVSRAAINNMKAGEILIWDNIWTQAETGLSLNEIMAYPRLEKIYSISGGKFGVKASFSVFRKN